MKPRNLSLLFLELDQIIFKFPLKTIAEHYEHPWNYEQEEIQNLWLQIIQPYNEKKLEELVGRDDLNIRAKRIFTCALDECRKNKSIVL
ncbi:hypothetical protein [Candidatus Uabimicrobium sp. HlEnr_7]|uniref:hypothetical protein n=1 Tax=Candidatus Uabimicrobium helgolandensis TaxID=3095367 RepID=UPI0035587B1B